ncbi:hypothetical protein Mnod_2409 [Methylobacterium nodulans ORS 2060]|uniref:Uncharacterized protein n=1 Tax=Methylobacterium nodulans (strain LMG 21967 / CNCM I-2342 / ORS 2060) TaxID=460265 RepID=B8IBG5_METNO|nr:hypothetical protein Mnod_2409 [Methylobacterium nodulans ORS 2060]
MPGPRPYIAGLPAPTIDEMCKFEQVDAVVRDYRQVLSSLKPCGPLNPTKRQPPMVPSNP